MSPITAPFEAERRWAELERRDAGAGGGVRLRNTPSHHRFLGFGSRAAGEAFSRRISLPAEISASRGAERFPPSFPGTHDRVNPLFTVGNQMVAICPGCEDHSKGSASALRGACTMIWELMAVGAGGEALPF